MIRETEISTWALLRGKIKNKFGKINDLEIDALKRDLSDLSNLVQKNYHYDQERAKQECNSFIKSLRKN